MKPDMKIFDSMKKILAMIALLSCALHADGKERVKDNVKYPYEVRLGWCGYPTADDNDFVGVNNHGFYSYDSSISDIFSDYDGPTYMTGNITGEMNFHFKKWFTLSVGVAANMIWKNNYSSQTDEYIRTDRGYTFTLMPQARFNWVRKDIVRLYSSVGAGVRGGRFDERGDLLLAAQLVPVGINVGDRLFGFAELGVGTLYLGGMFGIGYRF